MSTTSERRRAYSGPVLLSHGFRPFFLSAGAWAVLAMLIWLTFLVTGQSIPSQFTGVEWHMHEMIFGYPLAVIAGFLLTAVPNWTGRMPIMGWPVAGLVGLWIAGRVTILFSELLHPIIPPIVDLGFFLIFAIIIAREILAGKNWRNLKVLGLLIALGLGNVIFYIEASTTTAVGGYGIRIGTGTIIFLIILISGRVIPSFTRNWLARQKPGRLPAPINRFDTIAIFVAALAIVLWVVAPETWLVRILSLAAGLLHILRLARWVGWRTLAEPLTTILHIGYLFIPLGFLILALGDLHPVWSGSPQIPHAWSVGAIGVTTLAMMTRVSLGHSGNPLSATRPITAIYVAIVGAAGFRIAAEILPSQTYLLDLSAAAWLLAFGGFVFVYFPILTRRKS